MRVPAPWLIRADYGMFPWQIGSYLRTPLRTPLHALGMIRIVRRTGPFHRRAP